MAQITIEDITNILSRYDFKELEVKKRGEHYILYIYNRYHEDDVVQDFGLNLRANTIHELVKKIIEIDVEKTIASEYKERIVSECDLESHCRKIKSLCDAWGEILNDIINTMKLLLQAEGCQALQHSYDFLKENGTLLAKYCIYYTGTNMVDTSIEWYLICGHIYMYIANDDTAYPDDCLEEWQAGHDVYDDVPLVDGDYGYWAEVYDFDTDELKIR